MSSILAFGKNLIGVGAQFLNQPVVKEGVKNGIGALTFVFGIVEAYSSPYRGIGRQLTY